jgi:cardiolipin synthase
MSFPLLALSLTVLLVVLEIAVIIRVILRPHRDPSSRLAWVVVIVTLPMLGMLGYLLLGEVNIGRRRVERMREVLKHLPEASRCGVEESSDNSLEIPGHHAHLSRLASSISGFNPVAGNCANLMLDSNSSIDSMISDINQAKRHVHLLFYIWLPDNNGRRVAEALMQASTRGIVCRVLVDDLGSRLLIRSKLWQEMASSGVKLGRALPVGNPLLRPLRGRIDLRNHRKIVVIDSLISYCGSQNCADPEFLIKAKYAPWVDVMMRFEGPVVLQNQQLFVGDWMASVDEDLSELLRHPTTAIRKGFAAQAIGTGPTVRHSAMPEMFETLMYSARRELTISTPYYVPDESMQGALCTAARRGVKTTMIFPAKNDSWIVGAASRSYYKYLLDAGVRIFEYEGGLLHSKTLTVDREITLIGSANMDRRSFDLNYENNILFFDSELTSDLCQRQQFWKSNSRPVTPETVAEWTRWERFRNNTIAMLGPVL